MIENFNPFISLGGDNQKVNHMAEAALEMNLTCNDLKKDLDLTDGDVVDMEAYALAKVCYVFKKNFISFKYISDGANNNAIKDWSKNIHQGEELFKSTILNNIN